MIQYLAFFAAGLLAGGVIAVTLLRSGRRILDALAGKLVMDDPDDARPLRHIWLVPPEQLPLATGQKAEFPPVRARS